MKRRLLILLTVLTLLVSAGGVLFLVNYTSNPVTAANLPETKVLELNANEFISQVAALGVQGRCASYLGLSDDELTTFQFLRIDRTELCEKPKVPVRYGAFLIINKTDRFVERVVPFQDTTTFDAGYYRYEFNNMFNYCNVKQNNTLFIWTDTIIDKYNPWKKLPIQSYGDEHPLGCCFRWQAPPGMTFAKDSTAP